MVRINLRHLLRSIYLLACVEVQLEPQRNKTTTFLRYLMQIIFWTYLPLSFGGDILTVNGLMTFNFSCYYLLSSTYQIMMCYRGKKISTFTRAMIRDVSEWEKKLLCCFSVVFMTLMLLSAFCLQRAVIPPEVQIERMIFIKENTVLNQSIGGFFFILTTIIYNVTQISILIYCVSLFILDGWMKRQTFILCKVAQSGREELMYEMTLAMKEKFEIFESLYSISPLIWLSLGLLDGTSNIINLNKKIFSSNITAAVVRTSHQVVTIAVLLLAAMVNERITNRKHQVIDCYRRGGSIARELKYSVMHSISQGFDNKLTMWNMVDLNRCITLSYLGTVVSFSVLFVQIENGSIVETSTTD